MGIVLSTFCGVTIPYPTLIKVSSLRTQWGPGYLLSRQQFWRSWMYQLDPYTRTLSAMVSTELQCVPLVNFLGSLLTSC